jgi:hypothetical protein
LNILERLKEEEAREMDDFGRLKEPSFLNRTNLFPKL